MQIAYVESLCKTGAQLGADVVRIFTAYESPGTKPARELATRRRGRSRDVRPRRGSRLHGRDPESPRRRAFTRPRCSNCSTTSTGRTASSASTRGRRRFAAKTSTKRAKLAAPHTAITTNADYIRLPRYRYRPELVNYEPADARACAGGPVRHRVHRLRELLPRAARRRLRRPRHFRDVFAGPRRRGDREPRRVRADLRPMDGENAKTRPG